MLNNSIKYILVPVLFIIVNILDYATNGMRWCVQENVLNGSANMLNPQGTATRAQVATIFMNAETYLSETSIGNSNSSQTDQSETENFQPTTDSPSIPLVSMSDAESSYWISAGWTYTTFNGVNGWYNWKEISQESKVLQVEITVDSEVDILDIEKYVQNARVQMSQIPENIINLYTEQGYTVNIVNGGLGISDGGLGITGLFDNGSKSITATLSLVTTPVGDGLVHEFGHLHARSGKQQMHIIYRKN